MEVSYYNLSGGINLAATKTELGLDTKKIYWSDSENVEIFANKGFTKQKGNFIYFELPEKEAITGMSEMTSYRNNKLVVTTESGKIYIKDDLNLKLTLIEDKILAGKKPRFVNFLNGIAVITEEDALFYIKDKGDFTYEVIECGLKDSDGVLIKDAVLTVFRGRLFVAYNSTIYYSALGTYDDFTTENDAGYIRDFHTDTDIITALKPYKDYLAIYKKKKVFLLSGVSPEDFQIIPFADKGSYTSEAIVNVDNKQYFLSDGVFALEQVGELNQIQLGSEITSKIRPEFEKFSENSLMNSFCIHYPKKNQVWYYFLYPDDAYFHTVWINDYVNKAWLKRKVPQNITCAAILNGEIVSADNEGIIYKEDTGNSFNGKPIEFMWKSPFLAITQANHRKTIDEFYFLLDSSNDNDFEFSVYKDFDSEYSDDSEHIFSYHEEHFLWGNECVNCNDNECWAPDNSTVPVWSINKDVMEKAEISEANYAIQLCVSGREFTNSCTIIGLHFKEIYNDD